MVQVILSWKTPAHQDLVRQFLLGFLRQSVQAVQVQGEREERGNFPEGILRVARHIKQVVSQGKHCTSLLFFFCFVFDWCLFYFVELLPFFCYAEFVYFCIWLSCLHLSFVFLKLRFVSNVSICFQCNSLETLPKLWLFLLTKNFIKLRTN